MKKSILFTVALALMAMLLTGCSQTNREDPAETSRYAATIDLKTVTSDSAGIFIQAVLYQYDTYDKQELKKGETITINGAVHVIKKVTSLDKEKESKGLFWFLAKSANDEPPQDVVIETESGSYFQLVYDEGTGKYRIATGTDTPMYYPAGTVKFPVSDDICVEIWRNGLVSETYLGIQSFLNAANHPQNMVYDYLTTEISLEDGEIVTIIIGQ